MLQGLDYLGVAVFAITGGLAAARRELDIVAFIFFASVTGLGGGTLRDVLLNAPVFWIANPNYLLVPFLAGLLTFYTAHYTEPHFRALLWADAIGLAAYAVMGAGKSLALGAPPLAAAVLGVMTATFGGILRDVLAGEPSVMLRREIYVTAAVVGSGVFVVLAVLGTSFWIAAIIGFVAAFLVRGGALLRGWGLPIYQRPT